MKVNFKTMNNKLYLLGEQIPNSMLVHGSLLGLENTFYKLKISSYKKDDVERKALWANPIEPQFESKLILWKEGIEIEKAIQIVEKAREFWAAIEKKGAK